MAEDVCDVWKCVESGGVVHVAEGDGLLRLCYGWEGIKSG